MPGGMMRGATLFSGIGAPECAAPFFDWRWGADIDEFANAVRAHHWPEVPNLGDVAAIRDPEPVDVLVFGSPCQSFSVAGKRLGLDDPRGNLALVALGLVGRLRPRWFVFENVPGLLSSAGGDDFAASLRLAGECGYGWAFRVLDAQYFGVPQRRRRVFVVGHLGDDWRPPAEVLFEPESLRGHPPPRREARQDVAPTLASRTRGGGGLGTDFDLDGGLIASTGEIAHCLNAGGMGRQDYETETLIAFDTTQITSRANRSNPQRGDPCHTLAAGAHPPAIAFTCKDFGGDAGPVAPTLRAMGHGASWENGGGQVAVAFNGRMDPASGAVTGALDTHPSTQCVCVTGSVAHALGTANNGKGCSEDGTGRGVPTIAQGPMVRRLTPLECERLQGFPDGWTDVPWRGGRAPDSRRYKAIGNSMAVPVLRWILTRLAAVDARRNP